MAFIKSDMRLVRIVLMSMAVMLILGWGNASYAVTEGAECTSLGECDCAGSKKVQCAFPGVWVDCVTTGDCGSAQCVAVNCSGATTTTVAATTTTVAGTTTTTTTVVSAPTVETSGVESYYPTETESRLSGQIISDGGSAVTDKGFCWSTSANPTLSDAHAPGTGNYPFFKYTATGLTPGTTYHFRAYATNAIGTSYGVDKTFTTLSPTTTTTTLAPTTTTTLAPTTTTTTVPSTTTTTVSGSTTTTTVAGSSTTTTLSGGSTTTTTVAGGSTTTTLSGGSTTTTVAGGSTTTTLSGGSTTTTVAGGSTTTTVAGGSTTTTVPSGSTTTTIPGSSTTTSVQVSTTTTTTTSTTTTTLPGTPQAGRNGEVSTLLNVSFTFQKPHFIVPSDDGQNFGGIKIVSLETAGNLKYNEADVAEGTECADVSKLIFTPEKDKNGIPYTIFTFKVKDKTKGTFSVAYTMTVNVILPGDVDHDGKLTLKDALLGLIVAVGKTPDVPIYDDADVNADGTIGIAEAAYVLKNLFLTL